MEKYEPARVIKTENSGKQELPDLSKIKIISSKIDRETKEGKIVIEVEEEKISNIPEKIFLQLGEGIEGNEDFNELSKTGEISWCHHKVFESDIEYRLKKEVEEVPEEVNLLAKFFSKERSESDPDSGKLDEMDDYFMEVYQKNTGNSFSFARLKAIEAVLIKYGYQAKEIPDEVVYRTVHASEIKPPDRERIRLRLDGLFATAGKRVGDAIYVDMLDSFLPENEYGRIEWLEPIQLKDLLAKQ